MGYYTSMKREPSGEKKKILFAFLNFTSFCTAVSYSRPDQIYTSITVVRCASNGILELVTVNLFQAAEAVAAFRFIIFVSILLVRKYHIKISLLRIEKFTARLSRYLYRGDLRYQ